MEGVQDAGKMMGYDRDMFWALVLEGKEVDANHGKYKTRKCVNAFSCT